MIWICLRLRLIASPSLSVVLLSILFAGCNPDFDGMADKRLENARNNKGDIEIVAINDVMNSNFTKGVLLGAEEINQRPEKLLGRTLKVNIEQESKTLSESKMTVRRIAANPKITAVLGHRSSSVAIPVSVIYERSQIIFMSPFATAKALTGHGFKYVFRMAPSNKIIAAQLASAAKTLGYRNIVVLYARNESSRELAFLFEDEAIAQGIKLIKRSSFFAKEKNYRPIISQFTSASFEAVFIASSSSAGALMAQQLREMGIQQPIIGSDNLNHAIYRNKAGNAANNTILPSLYRPDENNTVQQTFIENYYKKYNSQPDFNAAQGYDSVKLLATAIERSGSTLAPLLSSTLHFMPAWVGVTGIHAYDQSGDILGKKYFLSVIKQGELHNLPALHVPYLLERFQAGRKQTQQIQLETSQKTPTSTPTKVKPKNADTKTVNNTSNNTTRNITSNITKNKPTNFIQTFSKRLHIDDHNTYLLDLAQEILNFKRIGIIYENTDDGRKAAGHHLLKILANRKKLHIVECEIPFSLMEKIEIERAMIACYGKLSLNVDAMFIPPYRSIDSQLLQQLNNSLAFFKIPAISLDTRNNDPNISLVLGKRADVNLQGMGDMQVYNNLLYGLKVHEFAEGLKNLPQLTINLGNLQRYDLNTAALLKLSPDNYLYSASPRSANKPIPVSP